MRVFKAALAVGVAFALMGAGTPEIKEAKLPNVLVLLTDDARAGTEWVMPHTKNWIYANGTSYAQAVSQIPSCCPSRSTIFSGKNAHNTGVKLQAGVPNFNHDQSLQRDLKAAGYQNAILGKMFNHWPLTTKPKYFDHSALINGGYYDQWWNFDGSSKNVKLHDYTTTFMGQQAIKYINEFHNAGKPWFVHIGFTAPHKPQTAEPKYANVSYPWGGNPATKETDRSDKPQWVLKYNQSEADGALERQDQLRTLMSVDDAIGSIHDALAKNGELDNTIVIFASDNGKTWSEHGLPEKFSPYLQADRVPLVFAGPGFAKNAIDNRAAGLLDITPTLLGALGMKPSYTVDGKDLRVVKRDHLLLEYWKDEENGLGFPTWASWYQPSVKQYIEYYKDDGSLLEREYYDLANDPWQLTNLLKDGNPKNDPALGPFQQQLSADRKCSGTACP